MVLPAHALVTPTTEAANTMAQPYTVTVDIGGQPRELTFRVGEIVLLERLLDCDVISYLAAGKGQLWFCANAIFAGMSNNGSKKISVERILKWFDEYPRDKPVSDLQKAILYAIAAGKPGKEGDDLANALEQFFPKEPGEVPTQAG
jgi:hypothetical protein